MYYFAGPFRLADFGRPEDFGNSAGSSNPYLVPSATKSKEKTGATGGLAQSQGNRVTEARSARIANRINHESDILFLDRSEKVAVCSILREGFKKQITFEKRVKKEVAKAKTSSMEEVLFATFGDIASEFVEFGEIRPGIIQVRLQERFAVLDMDNLIATIPRAGS